MRQHLPAILALGFFALMLGFVIWLGLPDAANTPSSDKIFVVTTVYPLAEFVQQVGGDRVYVVNVTPAGAEPHDYEPSPRDVARVADADLLVYVGGGLDTWAADMSAAITANGRVALGLDKLLVETKSGLDPHVWLDPVLAQEIVKTIQTSLVQLDPEHADEYKQRSEAYIKRLNDLDADYFVALKTCDLNDIIVSHDAFGYLARRYDFVIHPITGLSPDSEPSVKDLTNLAREAKKLGVKTVFFETLVSPELAQTLAKEVGAETAVLNPLEGLSETELAAGDDYVSVMMQNLQALRTAMLCQ